VRKTEYRAADVAIDISDIGKAGVNEAGSPERRVAEITGIGVDPVEVALIHRRADKRTTVESRPGERYVERVQIAKITILEPGKIKKCILEMASDEIAGGKRRRSKRNPHRCMVRKIDAGKTPSFCDKPVQSLFVVENLL